MGRRLRVGLVLAGIVAAALFGTAGAARAQTIGGCQVFPVDNPWNRDVSNDPLHPNSAAYVASISLTRQLLHPDFGSNLSFGIPFVVVPGSQPKVPITFDQFGSESDPGPYPIPPDAPVEGGSDRHVLAVDSGDCTLYELYQATKDANGPGWTAGSGARWPLGTNALRPEGWTSADAAGLPILPGLVRYDEVTAGSINHALRFTVFRTQRAYVHPATHFAGATNDPAFPPMGLRLRLKASFDLAPFTGQSRVVLNALKRYGMMVADNGSSWFISGATDSRWNDSNLNQIKTVPGSAFEVVESGPLRGQVTPTPTAIRSPTPTVAPACAPRPPVGMAVQVTGAGRLQATVTAQGGANARLLTLAFGAASNALLDLPGGPTGVPGNLAVALPANTQQTTFTVRRVAAGQAVTVPLTVTDSCGTWPTFVGAGPQALGDPAEAPPAAVATAAPPTATPALAPPTTTPAPTPRVAAPTTLPTATPTPAPTCAPRPTLDVSTAPGAPGQLLVTASAPAAANDWLLGLRVASAANGTLDVGDQTGLGAGAAATFAPGTRQATFTVRRLAVGQGTTINLVLTDSCGEWPTVVGGGPDAF